MKDLISNPVFGVFISLFTFQIGLKLYKKTKNPIFNPLLISIILVIVFLKVFKISLDDYNKGGQLLSFFLGPATVVLAVPLYKKIDLLKKELVPILCGIILGSTIGMLCIILLGKFLRLPNDVIISLVPKSVTTPIGMEISKELNGIPSLTVGAIVITGILGAIIAPIVCKIFRIKGEVAKGIAIGTSAHAIGTTKALEMGEIEGAMSGLSIGLAGLVTVLLAPIMVKLFLK